MQSKKVIYFADLTHQGLVLSSNVFPLAIGLVGAYLKSLRPEQVSIDLFKYPDDLSLALESKVPDIVAFSNYSWNLQLAYKFSKTIKKLWPNVIIVFGGPNYGLEPDEVAEFWKSYPEIDFNIVREGEEAFVSLFDALCEFDFDASRLKLSRRALPNCHYMSEGELVTGPELPRLDLEKLPSPYLMGLMDKFFDGTLLPMIHTTRGCPFKCAFCTEGAAYYNLVEQRIYSLEEELDYISSRAGGVNDLFISDANFGMFKADFDKARMLSGCQKKYGYPRYIHVSTGKNQKERVLEIAQMLDGALNMAASLQSTDPDVLKNIDRSNISIDKLSDVGLLANQADTGTYSEIILGLPGDSFASHRQSLRDTVEANFDNIRMYQLIMLPQTKLNTTDMRNKFSIKSKHRIMPRSFGQYYLAGESFIAVESEEILIQNSTMTFDDYVACRELDLTVEIIHNGKVYLEIQGLCQALGISWFDFIIRFYDRRRTYSAEITKLYDDFSNGMSARLWSQRTDLEDAVEKNFQSMQADDRGTNEMSTGKATAFFDHFNEINQILFSNLRDWLDEIGQLDATLSAYIEELSRYSFMRKADLLTLDIEHKSAFWFDMKALEDANFAALPLAIRLKRQQDFIVRHNSQQSLQLAELLKEFGDSRDGRGKMLMRHPFVHRVFRRAEAL
jgi:radical SAM superfamily enzyme YgiQ (UPF0313 family)